MVNRSSNIWTDGTPSTKKDQKSTLFFSLAGVKCAQKTPRHTKIKILADIIKYACNRFNIDPKDLFDDLDSCAQSKSSSRARAKGDEKEDEHAFELQKGVVTHSVSKRQADAVKKGRER